MISTRIRIATLAKTLPVAAGLALLGMAMPAAAGTQDNLRDCKAQLVLDGHVSETDRVSFDSARRSSVKLVIESETAPDRIVTCKVRRGKVVSLSENDTVLVARKLAATAGN